jgi:ElaB/YqjD/DUF883 family membrane-anchored ribosome-binding protein
MNDQPGDMRTQAADPVQELALRFAAVAGGRIAEGKERIKEYVSREPMRALGLALGAGVIIGWLIKRR